MDRLRNLIPRPVFSLYHLALAYAGAVRFGFPSRRLIVVGVTGTNGKTSTTEFINAIFEEAGYATALSNSIRVKVAGASRPGTGRSMPGRFFLQRFLRDAVRAKCGVAVIEMTSQGAAQHRHRAIAMNCLVFLNLAPEHIEAHGSLKAYADAKFLLGRALARSSKRPRTIVANADDAEGPRYLALPVEKRVAFSLTDGTPYESSERGGRFLFSGVNIEVALPGEFYLKNALAAAQTAAAFDIGADVIARGIAKVRHIPGRLESIVEGGLEVVIDYALTPDALEALYKTYASRKKICVFGSAGGGRDVWKRPVLGGLAEKYCDAVMLTNDIAYDEDPKKIIRDIAAGMKKAPEIVPDRRLAIRRALELARERGESAIVLLTGMGVDTEITAADGSTIPWSEANVVREEIAHLSKERL